MFRFLHQLTNHCLDDTNVTIQDAANNSTGESHPEIDREADDQQRQHGAHASEQENGFAANLVREAAPEHSRDTFRESEGGDEDSGVKRRIALVTDVEIPDHNPGVGEDGGQGDGLGESTYCCRKRALAGSRA